MPSELNFRRHPKNQQDALSGLVSELGYLDPIIVQAGTDRVLDGHLRVELALRTNQQTIPVTYVDLTDAEADLALASIDPVSAMAYHDAANLKALLDEVSTSDAAVMAMLSQLAEDAGIETIAEGLTDPDDVPAVPDDPITKPGDLWQLGRHRLLCGDATVVTDVDRLMQGERADMVFTDPPYGVDIQERDMQQAEVRGRRKDGKGVLNDDLSGDSLRSFLKIAFVNAMEYCRPGSSWYVCAPPGVDYRHSLNALAEMGIARHGIVWVKDRFVMGRADYHYRHENIIFGWVPHAAHFPIPTRDQDSVWEFNRPGKCG